MTLERYRRGTPPAFTESQPQYLQDELQKIEKVIDQSSEVSESFQSDLATSKASITTLTNVVADGDQALAQRIETFNTQFTTAISDANAKIVNETTARSTATEAVASKLSALTTSFKTQLTEATAAIQQEATTRSTANESLARTLQRVSATFSGGAYATAASVTAEATARADRDTALAQATTDLSTTVGGHTTSIRQNLTSIDGISANYGVRINNNGHVAGFGLNSGAGGTSGFVIEANSFAIVNPANAADVRVGWDGTKMIINGDIYANNLFGNVVNTGNVVAGAITTGTVAAGAITSRSSYYDAAELTIPGNASWYAWASLGITTAGLAVTLVFSTSVRIGSTYSNDGGTTYTLSSATFRIRRNDGAIVYQSPELGRGPFCATVTTDVGAGYHEYFAEISAVGEVYIANRSMFGLETKR